MQKTIRLMRFGLYACLCALGLMIALPQPGNAAQAGISKKETVNCPTVLLKHWKDSTHREQMAFLVGFVSMLEIEREWQGEQQVSIDRSINGSWAKGLSGVTFGQMSDTLNQYITDHPDELEKGVIEVLGVSYVRPNLTPVERKKAGDRYRQVQSNR